MVRRLARRARSAPRQGLQDQEGRSNLYPEDASRRRRKKSPSLGTVSTIAAAWAEANASQDHARPAAQALNAAAGSLHPHQLTETIVAGICAQWRTRYAQSTRYTNAHYLRRLLRHLETFGAPPLHQQVKFNPPHPRTVTLATGELEKLIAAAPIHLQLLLHLCSQLALRFTEAYELTPGDHDPEQHTIRVHVKGGKTRTLPTTPEIETLVAAARQSNPTTRCIETLAARTLGPQAVRAQFRRLVRATGVNPAVNPHDLRRTTATKIYALTKDLRAAQQMLGHDRLTSTLHYIAPLAKENLSELLHQLWRPKGPVQ